MHVVELRNEHAGAFCGSDWRDFGKVLPKDMGVDGLSPQQWQILPEGKSCGDVVRPDFGCDKPVLLESTLNHSEKNSLD